ncbi:MAG TPA: tryptophan 7-halogenase [Verrucomicrobiae bacterium]|nr:tryptophan 7-halogenase [Verrucomicrobiae bacterium]
MTSVSKFDFVIFGAGFGGSIMAMVLRRLGYSVLLLERGKHPRFAIGESSTPFANLLLETLAEQYDLPFLRSISEWGLWQTNHPEIGCGLKRGFTFYHHSPGNPIDFQDRSRQLLVAASPNDRVADTHWYRPDFDLFLLERAMELGVTYHDDVSLNECELGRTEWNIAGTSGSNALRAEARFAIDASGANGFLTQCFGIPEIGFETMPRTAAVYAHFKNVPRLEENESVLRKEDLPYPPDEAAVHHVFDDGWIWVLRFNNGITSAGAAVKHGSALHGSIGKSVSPQELWNDLLTRFPSLKRAFANARPTTPFYYCDQLAFRREYATGLHWALLPSAAGFVDPLLSTGFALTLLGIDRLGRIFGQGKASSQEALRDYNKKTFVEVDAAADLVSALYAKMDRFEEFALLSLLYFGAMSFTEAAWRLGRRELASGFLLTNDAEFTTARKRLCAAARAGEKTRREDVAGAIRSWDIAGLTDWQRRNWYPVRLQDLIECKDRLGMTIEEIQRRFADI